MAESGASPGSATPKPKAPVRACDACRYRRVKCDAGQPCFACCKNGIACTYLQLPKKKGPAAKRINRIRQEQRRRVTESPAAAANLSCDGFEMAVPLNDAGGGDISNTGSSLSQKAKDTDVSSAAGFSDTTLYPDIFLTSPGNNFIPGPSLLDTLTSTFETGDHSIPDLAEQGQRASTESSCWMSPWDAEDNTSRSLVQTGLSLQPSTDSAMFSALLSIKPAISLFYERLHPTIPVFVKRWLLARVDRGEHAYNSRLRAMLLAMNALVLIQPIKSRNGEQSVQQLQKANELIGLALRTIDNTYLGEDVDLDAIMTSFYLFACFFGLQKHGAAWFRLREATTLGQLLRLDDPDAYEGIAADERERRLRAYKVLVITERAYALQRNHPIIFRGQPGQSVHGLEDSFLAQHLRLFDFIDETVVDCWNGHCTKRTCTALTAEKALSIQIALSDTTNAQSIEDWSDLSEQEAIQHADLQVTQHWLRNRIWQLCLGHGLIDTAPDIPRELSVDYAVDIAKDTLSICEKAPTGIIEACGLGFIEKLFDNAQTLLNITALSPWECLKDRQESGTIPIKMLLNKYLAIMAVFREGQHPYLRPLIQSLSYLPF